MYIPFAYRVIPSAETKVE